MVLGTALTDKDGNRHRMAGLLPHETLAAPRLHLGYRRLRHDSPLPWPVRCAAMNSTMPAFPRNMTARRFLRQPTAKDASYRP